MDNDDGLRTLINTKVELYFPKLYFPKKRLIVSTIRPVIDISNYSEISYCIDWPEEWESRQIVLPDKINGIYELFSEETLY